MIVKFNPTGTHVHKGFLKVRIDLYPDTADIGAINAMLSSLEVKV